MDLHLRAAVAEAAAELLVTFEQPAVKLSGRHVRDHCATGAQLLAAGKAHAARAPVLDQHLADVAARLAYATAVLDQAHERVHEPRPAAARDRHAALLDGEADHLSHEAGSGRVRPEPGVQHPRRK